MKKTIKKICFFIISLVILTLLFPELKVFGETEITEPWVPVIMWKKTWKPISYGRELSM